MRWLEIITLRFAGSDKLEMALKAIKQMTEAVEDKSLISAYYYRDAEVENDLSVHLHWNSNVLSPNKSALGCRLAHLLHDFGSIHHATWIQEKLVPHD